MTSQLLMKKLNPAFYKLVLTMTIPVPPPKGRIEKTFSIL